MEWKKRSRRGFYTTSQYIQVFEDGFQCKSALGGMRQPPIAKLAKGRKDNPALGLGIGTISGGWGIKKGRGNLMKRGRGARRV